MHITSLHMKARVAQLVAMLFHDLEAIRFEIYFPFRVSPEISPLQRTTFGMPEEKNMLHNTLKGHQTFSILRKE